MDKLNVCLLNDSFPPLIDGVATAVMNYATVIQNELGSAAVVTPAYPGAADDYDFPVIRYSSLATDKILGYRAGYPFSASKLEFLKNSKFDILHSHCPFASTVMARNIKQKRDVPLIMTYHTKFDEDIKRVLDSPLLEPQITKFVVQNISVCDEVWTVSRGAGENLRSIGYEGDYIIMPNGVDFPKGAADPDDAAELRALYGISEDTPLFLFVGRLFWYKGFGVMLEALRRLADTGTRFKMLIVGDGGDRDEIARSAEELGLSDHIIFAGAINDREELRVFYTAADLFVFPSVYDTNGIVVREAAACGLASLLIRGSCAAEDFTNNKNAILAENDGEAVAKELIYAAAHVDVLHKMGENAMNDVYMSWEDAVKRAFERYHVVIDNYARGITHSRETKAQEILYSSISGITNSIQMMRSITASTKRIFFKNAKSAKPVKAEKPEKKTKKPKSPDKNNKEKKKKSLIDG